MVAPLVHLLVSGGPSDQARAARALSNMATESSVKEQIIAEGAASHLSFQSTDVCSLDLFSHSMEVKHLPS